MATYTKDLLSGSTNGKGILVEESATAGTLIHTAVSGATDVDEVWLYAANSSALDVKLTLEWGGVTSPDDLIEVTIPAEQGLYLIAPGLLLQNALVIRAFALTVDVISIHGFVNRIAA